MSPLSSNDPEQRALAHIWGHLSSELQTRVIGLLADLALNLVVARPHLEADGEANKHVEQAADAQNPS